MSMHRKLVKLVARQRGRCFLCHQHITQPTVDHVHPRSKGGSGRMENLRAACRACNAAKGNMTLAQYREWQKGRAA